MHHSADFFIYNTYDYFTSFSKIIRNKSESEFDLWFQFGVQQKKHIVLRMQRNFTCKTKKKFSDNRIFNPRRVKYPDNPIPGE